MKRGTPEHPKFHHLCQLLNLAPFEAAGLLEMLWHFAAKFTPRGDIGKYSDKAIAAAIGWKRPTGTKGVTPECKLSGALVEAGWLDSDPVYRLLVHDWSDHMDQGVERKLTRQKLDAAKPQLAVPHILPENIHNVIPPISPTPAKTPNDRPTSGEPPNEDQIPSDPQSLVRSLVPSQELSSGNGHHPRKSKNHPTIEELQKQAGISLPWWKSFREVHPAGKWGVKGGLVAFLRVVTPDEAGHLKAQELWRGAKAYAAQCAADPTIKPKWMQGWINEERWTDVLSGNPVPRPLDRNQQRREETFQLANILGGIKT